MGMEAACEGFLKRCFNIRVESINGILFVCIPFICLFVCTQRSQMPVYKKMWDFMNGRKHVYVPTYDEGIQRVREKKGKIYSPDSFYMIYIFDHV